MFKKILIANRGEIACRIMRTCHEMGVATVAVYSDADEDALHVRVADEVVHIGGALAADSYLDIGKIVGAAKKSGAEAIHPGYGFLSENAEFVEAVEAAGLVFIGPSADAIRAMGLKDAAKILMENAGVPVVPGYHGDNQDADFLANEAEKIGFPVLIKARAGGGGKGMRLVEKPQEFSAGLEGAVREGQASFGDGHVLIEKYISSPRHIEIQVFGDNHGNVVHMFERDCSLQRRHQKVIEEAPAPGMTDAMRDAMGDAAVKAAKAVNYSGAGTVEFIVDGSGGLRPDRFWFMEMNTRLQVEHPVTEMITGLDLVELQIHVANGEKLPFTQEGLSINGWAFETRIYAEDPANGFLPSVGDLHTFSLPDNGVRSDFGVETGCSISPHYDPMIGKLISHGADRKQALTNMVEALKSLYVGGVITNAAFLAALCSDDDFVSGNVDTGLIARKLDALTRLEKVSSVEYAIAAIVAIMMDPAKRKISREQFLEMQIFQNWRHFGDGRMFVDLKTQDGSTSISLTPLEGDWYEARCGVDNSVVRIKLGEDEQSREGFYQVEYRDSKNTVACARIGNLITTISEGVSRDFQIIDPLDNLESDNSDTGKIVAPMPGLIKSVKVKAGDVVNAGDVLVVLEAMKMEHSLVAPWDGIVEFVKVQESAQVEDAALLLSLKSVSS